MDLTSSELRRRLAAAGATADDEVYAYVIDTVKPANGLYRQTGSAPNWQGHTLTLCTCKHDMRATLSPDQWRGKWVAGFNGWSLPWHKQQGLVILMRVGETYGSQAELVQALRDSGRQGVVSAKDSRFHPFGDLMIPRGPGVPRNPHDPQNYHPPIPGHAHSPSHSPDGWHDDVDHKGRGGKQAAMLVGEEAFSFCWTRPMVRRRHPGLTRPYRVWTMAALLDDLEAVPS